MIGRLTSVPLIVAMVIALPGLGSLVPSRAVAWYGRAVYRLRIRSWLCPAGRGGGYEGIRPDAIPSDPFGW